MEHLYIYTNYKCATINFNWNLMHIHVDTKEAQKKNNNTKKY